MSDRKENWSNEVLEGPSTNQNSPLKKLYSSLLGQVFAKASFLNRLRVELVSKKFECAARRYGWTAQNARRISWKTMVQYKGKLIYEGTIKNEHIASLLRRVGPLLRELDLEEFSFRESLNCSSIVALFSLTPNITVLNLKHVDITASDLDAIAEHLSPKLKEIHFCGLFLVDAIRRFFVACTKLEVVRILEITCLDTLPTKLRALKLELLFLFESNVTIDDRCADHLETLILIRVVYANLQSVLPKCTKLKSLQISHGNLKPNNNLLSPSCFGPALQHLKISSTDAFNDECLRSITHVCQSIRTLELESFQSLTVDSLRTLAKLPNLVDLKLYSIDGVSDDVLKAIARRKKLETLKIMYLNEITDDSIQELVNWCKNLKSLVFGACRFITDDGLRLFSELPKLSMLGLDDCEVLSDQTLKAISSKGILKKLNVKWCQNVTDESIIETFACCKSLVELNVYGCPQVTDRSLDALKAEMERRHGTGTEPFNFTCQMETRRFRFF